MFLVVINGTHLEFSKVLNTIYILFFTKSLLLYLMALMGMAWTVLTYWKFFVAAVIGGCLYLAATGLGVR